MSELNVDAVIHMAVAAIHEKYGEWVEWEDLRQEAGLWVLENAESVAKRSEMRSAPSAAFYLKLDIMRGIEKYARFEKASKLGYDPRDEYFYKAAIVSTFLPIVELGQVEQPVTESEEIVAQTDPAEGGSWNAMRIDVDKAWHGADLTPNERSSMCAYHVLDDTQSQIAEQLGVTQQTVSKYLRNGMRKVVDLLGGDEPPGYDQYLEDKLRIRPGIHSETSGANQEMQ